MLTRRTLLIAAAAAGLGAGNGWPDVARTARGQSVVFAAWDGDERVNALIAWAGERMRMLHDVRVQHRRLAHPDAASRALNDGSADLVSIDVPALWFASRPPAALVPWRRTQLVFVHDLARGVEAPLGMAALLEWARAHPGRLTHPVASDRVGAAFLAQALTELAPNRTLLAQPATPQTYAAAAASLWAWYRAVRPHLWSNGHDFPRDHEGQSQLFTDRKIDLYASLNPGEAASGVAHGLLPATTRAALPRCGGIGGCSYVALAGRAAQPTAAMLLADFLDSAEAQSHAAHPDHGGNPPNLDMALSEPHPSWMARLAADWWGVV